MRTMSVLLMFATLVSTPALARKPKHPAPEPATTTAAPGVADAGARAALRDELVKTELEMAADLASGVKEALDEGVTVGDDARAAWEEARSLQAEARTLHEGGQDAKAFAKAREAVLALHDPAIAIYTLEPVPAGFPDVVAHQVQQIAARFEAMEPLAAGSATEEVKTQWQACEAAHAEAKELWTSGDKREGYRKSWTTLKELDKTVRLIFPEADAAASE